MMNKQEKISLFKNVTNAALCFIIVVLSTMLFLASSNPQENNTDSQEIEKKWLIDKTNIPYDLENASDIFEITQTYLNFEPEMRVRKIVDKANQEEYIFTVKADTALKGYVRDESEWLITKKQYEDLLEKGEAITIHKTRYVVYEDNGLRREIDIFHDDFEGLAYMETEFPSVEIADQFDSPVWVVADVTEDLNYKNGHLVRYGFPDNYDDLMNEYKAKNE